MKKWSAILACLLLAAGIWLMINLSRTHSDLETVSILVTSSIEGHSDIASEPVDITARCKASGFNLIKLELSKDIMTVRISPSDFTALPDGVFAVDKDRMFKYIADIFGPGVSVEAFAAQSFKFRFERREFRKVPVKSVSFIDFRSQYTATAPLSLSPDSIAVYGEPESLRNIRVVYTKPIELKDVKSTVHGITGLQVPEGTSLSAEEVTYELPVSRYVDITENVRIVMRNAPSDKTFEIFPKIASVTYRCKFPPSSDPRGQIPVFIDYRDFEKSISGNCMLRAGEAEGDLISIIIEPQSCSCAEMPLI